MIIQPELMQVMQNYTNVCHPVKAIALDEFTGMSTRHYYKIVSPESSFCLRQWGSGQVNFEHLQFMQSVLWTADFEGSYWLPLPFETDHGTGYVEYGGTVWELVPWFSGSKLRNGEPIRQTQLYSVFEAVASFHQIGQSFPVPTSKRAVSPRVLKRFQQWQLWVRGKLAVLNQAVHQMKLHVADVPEYTGFHPSDTKIITSEFVEAAKEFVRTVIDHSGKLISMLSRSARVTVPQQPVLQTLQRPHLLFDDAKQLAGLTDTTEIAIDTIAVDLAMILAFLSPWGSTETILGISHYRRLNQISDSEHYLMLSLYYAEMVMYSLDRLSRIFLATEPGFISNPNVALIAMIRGEIEWALSQMPQFVDNSTGLFYHN